MAGTSKNCKRRKTNKDEEERLYPQTDVSVWLRSCEEEITVPLKGTKSGTIPIWLNGSLIRNGPGSLKAGESNFQHLFDGSALLHKFYIKNGRVTYQCRFIKTDTFKKNQEANRIVVTGFGTASAPDPCSNIFKRFWSFFTPRDVCDNANISVHPIGDELYAFAETPFMHKIDKNNLETLNKVWLQKYVSIVHHTSHPHVEPDGTVYNLGLSTTIHGPQHNIIRFPPSKDKRTNSSVIESVDIVAKIPTQWKLNPSYMHTFGITSNYFIIVEQPLYLSIPSIIKTKILNKPLAGCLKWFSDRQTLISLVSRKTGKLAHRFYAEAFFYLHIINQYEYNNHVIIDICCYKDPSMLDCMYVESMKNMHYNPNYAEMFRCRPLRFVLPLIKPKKHLLRTNMVNIPNCAAKAYNVDGNFNVYPELLADVGCETPRINYEKYLGKKYRYFYAIGTDVDSQFPGKIIKVDTLTKTYTSWQEENCYASEAVYVESPNAKDEDDGVLLSSLVWSADENHVSLIILSAKTMKEIGRYDFYTKSPITKCLHGWFLSE